MGRSSKGKSIAVTILKISEFLQFSCGKKNQDYIKEHSVAIRT